MEKYRGWIEAWDVAHWEFSLAFENLSDEDLWKRPDPRLLSVGELSAHVVYSEALLGQPMPESPLVDRRFGYYLNQVEEPVTLDLSVARVLDELKTIHEVAKAAALRVENIGEVVHWRQDWTWSDCVKYMGCFHVAYHTGQAFSVRHLMGHRTNDN